MLRHYPYSQLGKAEHGWLRSSHHFSFANYYNPSRMGFGKLRVVNDDWVKPGTGFGSHPHKNMEIISFIRSGAISHKDSEGNEGQTRAGEVQVMSAGTGVYHSEYNLSSEPLTFYQIWIQPNQMDVTPRWQSRTFPTETNQDALPLLVSGWQQDDALFIHQQARIFGGKIDKGINIEHKLSQQAYILASFGQFKLSSGTDTIVMNQGDGAEVTELKSIQISALEPSEVIIIEVPN